LRPYTLPLAPGDHVRLFQSTGTNYGDGTGGPIGRNGTVLEVLNADAGGITLKNENGRIGVVTWDKLAHGDRTRLAYGDAMTINTAQGSSRGEQITAFSDGTDRVCRTAGLQRLDPALLCLAPGDQRPGGTDRGAEAAADQ
jgi:hypothetical protein